MTDWNRRDVTKACLALGMMPTLHALAGERMMTKTIRRGDEVLPAVGLGTYNVFDVESTPENIAARKQIVDLLIEYGGSVVDTSPMYNRSEKVIGDVIAGGVDRQRLFLATKVWTDGKDAGARQMARSAELMQTNVIDLMQVHNLRDLATQMATIRDWKKDGRIRYDGVTDYRSSALDDLEGVMAKFDPDFIQINYSLGESQADKRVLPMAADMGISVIVNRPFVAGRLFQAVGNRPLPDWAREFAGSWAQFFLKWIVSHPAVTCVIPATSKLRHMTDNLQAGLGGMPDAGTRTRMQRYIESL